MAETPVTRRVMMGGAVGAVAMAATRGEADPAMAAQQQNHPETHLAPGTESSQVVLRINGQDTPLAIEPSTSLLDALREQTSLTGTKKGCDHGSCGACTVHVDGRRVNACLTLAMRCQGKAITTIEGLSSNGNLHRVQAAFLEHDGFQCGYCTSGQIMSAVALIKEGHAGSDVEIREWMSGNICRCGAYPNIVAAIRQAHQEA
jgi:xanthine dehydrogenase YagT iron-sulfur-binding subunit